MCPSAECGGPGKHPVGKAWQKRATTDNDGIRDAFSTHRGNIGLALGREFIALDFDGEEGEEAFMELAPAPTLMAVTGSGGRHLVYRLEPWQQGKIRNGVKTAPGLDIRADGGHIVAAPSRHASGGVYRWETQEAIAPLPDDLFRWLTARQSARVIPVATAPRAVDTTGAMFKRTRAYLRTMERSVDGAGGSMALMRALGKICAQSLTPDQEWALANEYNDTMCDGPWSEKELAHALENARRDRRGLPLEERRFNRGGAAPVPAAEPPPDISPASDAWKANFKWEEKNKIRRLRKLPHNVRVYLQHHPDWKGRVRFDTFRGAKIIAGPPWAPEEPARTWTDIDTTRLQAWLVTDTDDELELGIPEVERGSDMAAHDNPFSPPREWMEGLTWDGVRRLDSWLVTYLGVDDTEYARLVGRWWLISSVARVFQPGCQVDYVLILEGEQGLRKSTALRALAGDEWFSGSRLKVGHDDAYRLLRGKLIVELQELAGIKGKMDEEVKAFLTNRDDTYTDKWQIHAQTKPRTCVFAGTTNEANYLTDPSGNRRYWPVRCTRDGAAAIAANREQLWAEAVDAYRNNATWWPETEHEHRLCEVEQDERAAERPWETVLADYLDGRSTALSEDLWNVLRVDRKDWPRMTRDLSDAMRKLGWRYTQDRSGNPRGGKGRYWKKL